MADLALLGAPGKPLLAADALREFAGRRGEAAPLVAARLVALAGYLAAELPDRVGHLWRYTDPAWLLPASPLVAAAAPDPSPVRGPARDGGEIVVRLAGGTPRSGAAAAEAGLQIVPLAAAGGELERLGTAVPATHGLFEALNAAAWSDGALVRLPRGTVLAQPLRVIGPAADGTTLPRLLIVAEAGVEATVVEEHVGGGDGAHVVGVSELFLAPGAKLRHVLLQRWTAGTAGHLTSRARLGRDTDLLTVVAALGGAVAKLDLGVILEGEGGHSRMVGVALGQGRQHHDIHTLHRHVAGQTRSNLDLKAVLSGRARSVYTGLIRIEAGAPHSEAYQENRNLLLSDRCRVDSIPELEILTDEVSCTHGATVSPVDPEQLFYLRSRGLSPVEAVQLVARGFLEPTLCRLPEPLRAEVEALVAVRLATLGGS
ncbi:MAG: Fe-S cluster assembly protein SufD [Candidatus Krumholzibacteriia bacterium]